MKNYMKILFIVIFFSGCSFLDKEKYKEKFLEEVYFNHNISNTNYIGMTRKQIVYIFGMPIIADSFSDVYHYYVYVQKNNISEKSMLNLYFKDNKVVSFKIQ